MTSDFKDDSLKLKDAEWLEQYLAGKAPLHAEDLHLPSAEELNAAEAAFDEIVAGRQKTARRVPLWAWAAAVAAVLMVAVLLWPQSDAQETPALMATRETPKLQRSEKEPQPVMAHQAKQEHLVAANKKEKNVSQKSETESLEQKIAGLTIVPTSADLGPGVTMRFGKPADTLALKGVDEPLEQKIVSLTIVPTSADLGPGVKMRFGGSADTLAHKGVDEPLEQMIASLTVVPTPADLGPGVTMRLGKPCPITAGVEPLQEEEVSPIPADKQALADLYLAEEALQVAYEQRAVREAVRAYTASIKGEKLPKPVIAF